MKSDAWVGLSGTRYKSRRPRGLAPWKPRNRLAQLLDDVIGQLNAEANYWPVTSRHIGYRLIGHAGYDKTERLFEDVETVVKLGRRAGYVSWEAIHDGRSMTETLPTWARLDDYLEVVPDSFHCDLLSDQARALEVWVEAAGMVPQVSAVADGFTVPVMTSGGFRTTSAIYALARRVLHRLQETKRLTTILLVGDLDDDGISAMDSTADDAWAFLRDMTDLDDQLARAALTFEIVAVTPEQVSEYGLEGKLGGTVRRGDYQGPEVQVEAFDAGAFAQLMKEAIERHIDTDKFAERLRIRDATRQQARGVIERGLAS